ncbi:leucine-rich repeat receptor-like tyrosine-protein kinase PXC3 [Salvia divinorum]|uniref:Leucine-rich repeat receptor-like tyrosine-protein kinase PXC3 n=1 Tax=Salvia divinorum TaxID=28513 RepID=A0ABD1IL14_SALDI
MALLSFLSILLFGLLSRSQFLNSQIMNDQAALLEIGKEFGISVWNGNISDYCSWPGISCSSNNSVVERLDLSSHGLQGNLTLISDLKSLKWLDLSYNKFHGMIPPSLVNLSELEFLDLSFNAFEGSIPVEFGRLRNLKALNLSNNLINGVIPDELESLVKLQDLRLYSNKLSGSIPLWFGNLTSLRVFTAYENALSGVIPHRLGLVSELKLLNLHSNYLEGSIPESIFAMEQLETLVLTQNRLSGYIPEAIGKCRGLSNVRIGDNNLSGGIPREIGNISSLTYFEANNNNLSGMIAMEFSKCSNLTLLNLALNSFFGTIPLEFGLLSNLQELIVSGNSLFGDIPTSILRGKNLNKLDLSNNRFDGTIPRSICNASKLQFLLLSQNSIKGEIPREIGNCTKLLELQLGSNYLIGTIPPEIGHIKNLQIALNLSSNRLHGQLPEELGRLDKLVSLDVSSNQLSGSIPSALKGMMSLIEVNFSNNHFSGPIPLFQPFQKSFNSSFLGNKGLCGEPLSVSCGGLNDSTHDTYHHKVSYKIILAVIGSGLAVFLSVTVIVLLFMMRERQENAAKDTGTTEDDEASANPVILAGNVFVENLQQAIDFDAVARATMKDSNLLSTGTFSTLYRADMPSGMTLSVRKLRSMDKTVVNHRSKMIREVEKLSKLCHGNLMRPIGFVLFEDVVLLLHQYCPNATLAQYLHDQTKKPDWSTRLNIATGVAEGLAFLHHVAIIHLDISSGNVVLDSNFTPLVGEVEISKLLDPSRGTASISAVAGSFGYIPPEYAYTMQVTAPGNVYSYGVVLLEILTTQLPVDEAFGEGIDLVKWVHSAPARGETPEQILDARLSTISFACRKEMLAALKVALLCTDSTPAKRPKMKNVVEMLQEIKQD